MTYEKKRPSGNMFDEENDCANTTGDKGRKKKQVINSIVLSDENPE